MYASTTPPVARSRTCQPHAQWSSLDGSQRHLYWSHWREKRSWHIHPFPLPLPRDKHERRTCFAGKGVGGPPRFQGGKKKKKNLAPKLVPRRQSTSLTGYRAILGGIDCVHTLRG